MVTSASTNRPTAFSLAVLLAIGGTPALADWPFARGGADSSGCSDASLGGELRVAWTYRAEDAEAAFEGTPVIADGVVVVGDSEGLVHAVCLADGTSVWRRAFADTGFLAAAAIVGDAAVITDYDGVARCLALADGAERWAVPTESEVYGGATAFTPDGGGETLVLITTEAGRLLALDAATGAERWRFAISAPLRGEPTVVAGAAWLAGCDGKLHAIDAATGEPIGEVAIGGPTGNTAAAAGGLAVFGIEEGAVLAARIADPAEPVIAWKHREARSGQGVRTAAAMAPGAAYVAVGRGVTRLDPDSGEVAWSTRIRGRVEASPLALTDGVLVLTNRGRVVLLDAQTGDEWATDDRGGGFLAAPAASGGFVVVANTDGSLVCYAGAAADGR
ncbi:MAG: PQQ-binding-like beta-propeller repeat protein [Planctomycetota bacterium]